MTNVVCPLCKQDNSKEIFNIGDLNRQLRNVICMNCGLIYINPRPDEAEYLVYQGDSGRGSGHHSRTSASSVEEKIHSQDKIIKEKVADHLIPYIEKGSRIVDVGCGFGTLLDSIREKTGVAGDGVELNENDVKVAQRVFGLELFYGTLKSFFDQKKDVTSYDLVILHHTLEHLGEPREELERIYNFLSEEGALYIGVPNTMNMKKRPEIFFQLGHATSFTPYSLEKMLDATGFKVVKFNRQAPYPGGMELIAKKKTSADPAVVQGLHEGQNPEAVLAYVVSCAKRFRVMRSLRDAVFFWLPKSARIKLGRIFYLWLKK